MDIKLVSLTALLTFLFCFAFVLSTEAGDEPGYIGSKACKSCHRKAYRSWKKTEHFSALDALKPNESPGIKKTSGLDPARDYTKDAECLKCHTTGYGKKDGFSSIDLKSDLAGVGCEMCHGPAELYNVIMDKKGRYYEREECISSGLIPDPRGECLKCHNEACPVIGKDYEFSLEERVPKVHVPIELKYHKREER